MLYCSFLLCVRTLLLQMASNSAACAPCNIFLLGFTLPFLVILVYSAAAQPARSLARSGSVFQVLVPVKSDFKEFVECSNDSSPVKGFCIDVFTNARDILIPKPDWIDVNYTCYGIGDDSYDTMVELLSNENSFYDAVVGDVTISASRMEKASFTQSYLDSGIVIVTPAKGVSQKFPGVFFVPFSVHTWLVAISSVVITALALWFLECHGNPHFQTSESRSEQLKKVFWFITSILIFFRRESIKSPLAKFVLIAWIIFILLLGSSYTASLSSILTTDKLSSVSLTIDDLSNTPLAVGYQAGSIVLDYLKVRHNISNLVELHNVEQYAATLQNGTVVAVVDEIPYISLFLAAQSASSCQFAVSPKLTIEGLGFAFRNKTLSAAFSLAILNLSERGEIKRLQDGWKLGNFQCPSRIQSTRLELGSSEGLFILLGSAVSVGFAIFAFKRCMIPCWNRMRARLTGAANPRQDAIDNFQERHLQVSIRRNWLSRGHITMGREDFI